MLAKKILRGDLKVVQKEIYARLYQMVEEEKPAALITLLETVGSAPGKPGFKMLVDQEGGIVGTIGGGPVEAMAIEEALEALRTNTPKISTYTLDKEKAGGLGMICGGEITVFIDVLAPPETLIIVGAGHIAQPLAAMGKILGFNIIVLDDRHDFCNKERFPQAEQCLVGDIPKHLQNLQITDRSYVVIITRGHVQDQDALEQTLRSRAAYLGMIGSKKKVETIFKNLQAKGYSAKELEKVHAPIGLFIGAKTAEEIALSILAQVISVKSGVSGGVSS